jgi:hypothetical protein
MPSSAQRFSLPIPIKGVLANLDHHQVPADALIAAQNVIRRFGKLIARPGLITFADDTDQRPLGFIQYDHENEDNRIVMGTDESWFHLDTSTDTWTDLDTATNPLTGGNTSHVVFRTFSKGGVTYLLGCNGIDAPKAWSGTGGYVDIGGSPPAASCMAVSYDRLILARDQNIQCSSALDFDVGWGSELDAEISDTPGDIIALQEHGNLQTVAYKENSIYNLFAQPDAVAPFRVELAADKVPGPVSPNAVVAIEDGSHVYLSYTGSVIRFDGVNAQSLGEHIQAFMQQNADRDLLGRAWGTYDPYTNEIYFFYAPIGAADVNCAVMITWPDLSLWPMRFTAHYPTAGLKTTISEGIAIGELIGTIGEQELTIGEYARLSGSFFIGDSRGQVYKLGGYDDLYDDGHGSTIHAQVDWWFKTGLSNFGDPVRYKHLAEIEIMSGYETIDSGLSVSFGKSNFGEAISYSGPKAVDMSKNRKRTLHRATHQAFNLFLAGYSYSEDLNYHGAIALATMGGIR